MEQKSINKMSGEELAEIVLSESTRLMQAQANLQMIQQELARRKNGSKPEMSELPAS